MRRNVMLAATCSALLCAVPLGAEPASRALSELSGRTLEGEAITLPEGSASRSALVVSFSREAGPQASEWRVELQRHPRWRDPVYNVLVLEGVPRFVRGIIRRGLRSSVPEDQHRQFVIVTEAAESWRTLTGAADDGPAYVVLLEEERDVCAASSGSLDPGKLEALLDECETRHRGRATGSEASIDD